MTHAAMDAPSQRRPTSGDPLAPGLKISVLIPTYRRPQVLCECVRSLVGSDVLPGEILVVGRAGDTDTEKTVQELRSAYESRVRICDAWVAQPGHIPPVEKGVSAAAGDLLAIVDDDVTVTPEWLRWMTQPFADEAVGVVGGRVVVPAQQVLRPRGKPGQIAWYGKHWGNLGQLEGTEAVEVAGVMEGNWMWRRELLASLSFDPVLNFDDASMYGLDLCLQARGKGFRVIYESRAVVHHHVAPRVPELDRADRPRRITSYSRNYTYIVLRHLPGWRRAAFLAWWFLIGDRASWGIGSVVAETLLHGPRWRGEVGPAWAGKLEGIRLWRRQGKP